MTCEHVHLPIEQSFSVLETLMPTVLQNLRTGTFQESDMPGNRIAAEILALLFADIGVELLHKDGPIEHAQRVFAFFGTPPESLEPLLALRQRSKELHDQKAEAGLTPEGIKDLLLIGLLGDSSAQAKLLATLEEAKRIDQEVAKLAQEMLHLLSPQMVEVLRMRGK